MGVVYVDVLVIINAVIGYFLMRCATAITSLPIKPWRLCAGALLAGLSSLLILFNVSALAALAIKAACMAAVVLTAFYTKSTRLFLKTALWYIFFNFMLGGIAEFAAQSGSVIYDNYSLYLYVPPLLLIMCTLFMYAAITAAVTFFGRPQPENTMYFSLDDGEYKREGAALLDTGFSVHDAFTGGAVILLSKPFPPQIEAYYESGAITGGIRLLPISTAAGGTLLPAVTARLVLDKRPCKAVTAVFTYTGFKSGVSAIISADVGVYF